MANNNSGLNEGQYQDRVELSLALTRYYHTSTKRWHLVKTLTGKQGEYLNTNEYQTLKKLSGVAGIAKAISLSNHHNTSVLIREYCQGQALSQILSSQMLSQRQKPATQVTSATPATPAIQELNQYLIKLAAIIANCHRKGIVHADIKPNNIIVNGQSLTLIDFAAAAPANSQVTSKPFFSYSPSYSHPSLKQKTGIYTPQLDWYSFMTICYIAFYAALPPKHPTKAPNGACQIYHFDKLKQHPAIEPELLAIIDRVGFGGQTDMDKTLAQSLLFFSSSHRYVDGVLDDLNL